MLGRANSARIVASHPKRSKLRRLCRKGTTVPIKLLCPGCRKSLTARDDKAGQPFRCPACGTQGTVPLAVAPSEEEPIHLKHLDAPEKPRQPPRDPPQGGLVPSSSQADSDPDDGTEPAGLFAAPPPPAPAPRRTKRRKAKARQSEPQGLDDVPALIVAIYGWIQCLVGYFCVGVCGIVLIYSFYVAINPTSLVKDPKTNQMMLITRSAPKPGSILLEAGLWMLIARAGASLRTGQPSRQAVLKVPMTTVLMDFLISSNLAPFYSKAAVHGIAAAATLLLCGPPLAIVLLNCRNLPAGDDDARNSESSKRKEHWTCCPCCRKTFKSTKASMGLYQRCTHCGMNVLVD